MFVGLHKISLNDIENISDQKTKYSQHELKKRLKLKTDDLLPYLQHFN